MKRIIITLLLLISGITVISEGGNPDESGYEFILPRYDMCGWPVGGCN